MPTGKTQCALCDQDIAATELRTHRERETREIVQFTINMIKARHPEWTQDDPACQRCWDYYQSLPTN